MTRVYDTIENALSAFPSSYDSISTQGLAACLLISKVGLSLPLNSICLVVHAVVVYAIISGWV